MRAMLKFLMIVTGLVLIAVAAALLFFSETLQDLGRRQAEERLARVLGSTVTIEELKVHPLQGNVELLGLAVHNPEGFRNGDALRCARLLIDAELFTLLSATPRIQHILAEDLEVELRHELPRGTNFGALVGAADARGRAATENPGEPATAPRRRLLVEQVVSNGGQVRISSNVVPGTGVSLELEPFTVALAGERLMPAQLVATLLRSIARESIGLDGIPRAIMDSFQNPAE